MPNAPNVSNVEDSRVLLGLVRWCLGKVAVDLAIGCLDELALGSAPETKMVNRSKNQTDDPSCILVERPQVAAAGARGVRRHLVESIETNSKGASGRLTRGI